MNDIIITQPEDRLMQSVHQSLQNENNPDTNFSFYTFEDVPVPRVTQILDKTINKPGLLYWAANLGTKNMYIERKKSTTIGTKVHWMIEQFLKTNIDTEPDFSEMYYTDIQSVKTAYNNFKVWYQNLTNYGYKLNVLASELKIVCPFYGGTADLVAEIGGAVYILDWKTSKKISLEYYIQTCAYMWAINNGYCPQIPHVDGIGIVRFNKDSVGYEESFLTYQNPIHAAYIDDYTRAFGALLQSYYNLVHIERFKHHYPSLEAFKS